jgi:hypothetical protein
MMAANSGCEVGVPAIVGPRAAHASAPNQQVSSDGPTGPLSRARRAASPR